MYSDQLYVRKQHDSVHMRSLGGCNRRDLEHGLISGAQRLLGVSLSVNPRLNSEPSSIRPKNWKTSIVMRLSRRQSSSQYLPDWFVSSTSAVSMTMEFLMTHHV